MYAHEASIARAQDSASPEQRKSTTFCKKEALRDLQALHKPTKDRYPWLTWHWRGIGMRTLQHRAVPADGLDSIISGILKRPMYHQEDHWVAQNSFKHQTRRTLHLHTCSALYLDIDLGIDDAPVATADRYAQRLLSDCDLIGIPRPTYIVWSGRGMHPKWILSQPLSSAALPRWNACQKYLSQKIAEAGAGWPVDMQARDASRILRLVGTCNNKSGPDGGRSRPVYLAWDGGTTYDFETLAEWILPYSREQIAQIRIDAKARAAAATEWQAWDRNRTAAQGLLKSSISSAAHAAAEATQGLHWHRLNALRTIAAARGGIQEGQRNNWTWITAVALAQGAGELTRLDRELPILMREIAPTYTAAEVMASAGSVRRRMQEGGKDALYRLKTATIIERLGLTDTEAALLRQGKGHETHQPGIMGMAPIKGLSPEAWAAEVRRRYSEGARHSTATRGRSGRITSPKAEQARAMRAQGATTAAIAQALETSDRAVRRWLQHAA